MNELQLRPGRDERLTYQGLDYMKYLKADYPYLFHLAARTNPFDPDASPIVT